MDVVRNAYFYFVQLGLTRRYLPFGDTALYAEYAHYNDFGVGKMLDGTLDYQSTHESRR
jgi:hypothetical protein